MSYVEHPFPPVAGPDSRVLILGSFPSVRSREEGFFYSHPRNRFWPLMAALYGEDVPQTIPERRAMILRHGLALWDVIASCHIEGSSDASVRDAVPVDIIRVLDAADIRYTVRFAEENRGTVRALGIRQAPTLVSGGQKWTGVSGVREFIAAKENANV